MKDWNTGAISIISCDVFDTLLKRNARSEQSRVWLIAKRAASILSTEHDIQIGPIPIAKARAEVQRLAYRSLDIVQPSAEVEFNKMVSAMVSLLGLPPGAAHVFTRAEIEVEISQLRPNRALLTWLAKRAREGFRIIAISDTWHVAATISELLDEVAPGHPIAKVYTSAELGATKRSAQIFPLVAAREMVKPERFLHIGDDRLADVEMAQKAGLVARQLVPARLTLLGRKLDGAIWRAFRTLPQV